MSGYDLLKDRGFRVQVVTGRWRSALLASDRLGGPIRGRYPARLGYRTSPNKDWEKGPYRAPFRRPVTDHCLGREHRAGELLLRRGSRQVQLREVGHKYSIARQRNTDILKFTHNPVADEARELPNPMGT